MSTVQKSLASWLTPAFVRPNNSIITESKYIIIAARRINRLPLPEKIHLSEASQHDLAALRELSPRLPEGAALFADKAYFHRETERDCKAAGWFLLASYKRHRFETEGDVPTYYNRFVSAIRQPLESLFGWVIQKTDLQNASRVRSSQGLKVQGSRQTCFCLFTAHFILLIRISYEEIQQPRRILV